ncbi:MAG: hypothetical protein ACE5HU_03515 [Acidobacteriota bacterium]
MARSSILLLALFLMILGGAPARAVPPARHGHPYTVITLDGHRFFAQEKPRIRGLQAFFRLVPNGQLATIKEELIDWDRTAAANRPRRPIAIRGDATLVQAETAGDRSDPADSPLVLDKEIARTRRLHDRAVARRRIARRRWNELQRGGPVPTGGADDRASEAARLRHQIENLDEIIDRLAKRLEMLRAKRGPTNTAPQPR